MSAIEEASRVRDEVIKRGQQVYDERLKALLEPSENGRFVAIEPVTGKFFLGGTGGEALQAAHEALPEARFFLKRIGNEITYRLGGYGNRKRQNH